MNNKIISAFFLALALTSTSSFAESFKIPLNTFDQSQLTNEMAKIGASFFLVEIQT